jgi:hypothetical protein
MVINSIQFQSGMSLSELFEKYRTEPQCEHTPEKASWPVGFHCPHIRNEGIFAQHNAATQLPLRPQHTPQY